MQATLFDVYRQRVDCVHKILHWPTVLADVERGRQQEGMDILFRSKQALEYSICYMALCSLTDNEAAEMALGERQILLQMYRSATETLLTRSNFLEHPDVTGLQAFVIYLVSLGHSPVQLTMLKSGANRRGHRLGFDASLTVV